MCVRIFRKAGIGPFSHQTCTSVRLGTAYEKIEDCVIDFACGIEKARELGYKRIILSGHSLGCNKSIYYYSQKKPDIEGIIMASMPDMFAYEDSMGEGYRERLLKEARNNISEGNPGKLVEIEGVSWVPMSSETYVNWYSEGSALDNIPVVRNPDRKSTRLNSSHLKLSRMPSSA